MFHKCDSTILSHAFVSFLALIIMHELKKRIDFPCEWDQIRQDLDALYEIEVESGGKTFLLRSPLPGVSGKVFRAVGVAVPPAAKLVQVWCRALFAPSIKPMNKGFLKTNCRG